MIASHLWRLPWPWCRKRPVKPSCWQSCPAMLQEQRPGVHGHKRRSASRGGGGAPDWWRSGWGRPLPHSGLQRGSRFLKRHMNQWVTSFTEKTGLERKPGVMKLTWNCSRDGAPQSSHCSHGNLLRGVLFRAGVSGSDHVWLQQRALQVHVVIRQRLVHSSQNLETGQLHYYTSTDGKHLLLLVL